MHRHSSHCTRGLTDEERLEHYVPDRPEGECWLWTGTTNRGGYGVIGWRDVLGYHQERAHRFAYRVWVGPIPDGLTLDHVRERGCTSRACVNPAHLEPVSGGENSLRGDGPPAKNRWRDKCIHGHDFDIERPGGGRDCSTCRRDRGRRYDAKRRHGRISA